jgi:hypothetical protein
VCGIMYDVALRSYCVRSKVSTVDTPGKERRFEQEPASSGVFSFHFTTLLLMIHQRPLTMIFYDKICIYDVHESSIPHNR